VAKPDVTANSPAAGSIAWAAFGIQYMGVGYAIPAGNTALRWVWWKYNQGGVTTALAAGNDLPTDLTADDLVLLKNVNGIPFRVQTSTQIDGELLVDGSIMADALAANSVTANAIGAHEVTADKVGADVMVANNVYASDGIQVQVPGGLAGIRLDANGFLQLDANGNRRTHFPSDPTQPNVMEADLTARGLTVLGRMSVRGTTNEISKSSSVSLAVATTKPGSGASATNTVDDSAIGNKGATNGASGAFWDGSNWYGMTRSGSGALKLVKTTMAGVQTEQALPFPSDVISFEGDIVKLGGFWYAIASPPNYVRNVYKFDATTLALVATWTMDYPTGIAPHYRLATDGTSLFHMASYGDTGNFLVSSVNTSTGARTTVTTLALTGAAAALRNATITSFRVGDFDFGARKYILSWGGTSYVFSSTGAYESNFPTFAAHFLGWDGTRFHQLSRNGDIYRMSTLKADRFLDLAIAWRDSDPGGTGVHETEVGVRTPFTQRARCGMSITCPPPADQGGADDPDSVAIFASVPGGTLRLIGIAMPDKIDLVDVDITTGRVPNAVSDFPDSAASSAKLQSASGGTYISGDGTMAVGIDPVNPTDVVNWRTLVAQRDIARQRTNHYGASTADWSNGDFLIRNLKDAEAPTDAANKRQVDALKSIVWVYPTLTGGWASYDNGVTFDRPAYGIMGGEVFLKGAMAGGVTGNGAFSLPVGMRPLKTRIFYGASNAGYADMRVNALGQFYVAFIGPAGASNAIISLDNVRFPAEA
jgi:hypothetical protein